MYHISPNEIHFNKEKHLNDVIVPHLSGLPIMSAGFPRAFGDTNFYPQANADTSSEPSTSLQPLTVIKHLGLIPGN